VTVKGTKRAREVNNNIYDKREGGKKIITTKGKNSLTDTAKEKKAKELC